MNYKKAYKTDLGKEKVLKIYDEILKLWPIPYEELNINTKYGNTHIIQCGDKSLPPLILLHGTSSNSTMWIGDVDKISRIVNGGTSVPKKAIEYSQLISKNFNLRTEPVPIYSDEELKKLNIPILLFAGENDALLDSKETIKRISRLVPNAKTTLLLGYGHVLIGLKDKIIKFLLES